MNNHVNKSKAAAAEAAAKAATHEAAAKAASFITSRRENIACSILYNEVAHRGCPHDADEITDLAKDCVVLADNLIKELYGKEGKEAAIELATICFGTQEKPSE